MTRLHHHHHHCHIPGGRLVAPIACHRRGAGVPRGPAAAPRCGWPSVGVGLLAQGRPAPGVVRSLPFGGPTHPHTHTFGHILVHTLAVRVLGAACVGPTADERTTSTLPLIALIPPRLRRPFSRAPTRAFRSTLARSLERCSGIPASSPAQRCLGRGARQRTASAVAVCGRRWRCTGCQSRRGCCVSADSGPFSLNPELVT